MTEEFRAYATVLILLVAGASNDLLDYVSADKFWNDRGVQISVDRMLLELKPPAQPDISGLLADLGNDDLKVRDAASKKLAKIGPSAIPQLEQAAKSPDAEVANRTSRLIADMLPVAKETHIRLLMAIRTLGELGDRAALPELRKLTDAPASEMFVADYARASIAAIEGNAPLPEPATGPAKSSAKQKNPGEGDIWILPEECDVVLQYNAAARGGRPEADLVRLLAAARVPQSAEPAQTAADLGAQLLPILQRIGDVRVDSMTIGLNSNAPGQPGVGIFVLRGRYDSKAAVDALREEHTPSQNVDDLEVFQPAADMAVIFVSDEQLIFVSGQPNATMPLEAVAKAVKHGNGKGSLKNNAAMTRLINGIDTSAMLWAACTVSDGLREVLPGFSAFSDITLVARAGVNGPDSRSASGNQPPAGAGSNGENAAHRGTASSRFGTLEFTIQATCMDGAHAAPAIAEAQAHLKAIADATGTLAGASTGVNKAQIQRLAAIMKDVKIDAQGATASTRFELPAEYAFPFLARLIGGLPPGFDNFPRADMPQ